MIIDNYHIACGVVLPYKTDSILLVNANAMLTFSFASQGFQSIAGWNSKIFQ